MAVKNRYIVLQRVANVLQGELVLRVAPWMEEFCPLPQKQKLTCFDEYIDSGVAQELAEDNTIVVLKYALQKYRHILQG